ncbi:MAG: nuclear transport factor 2 family protein [Bdellovibrionales bacterium]
MLLELVMAQLYAWNAGKMNEMMAYYHDDVKVYSRSKPEPFLDSKQTIIEHIKPDFDSGNIEKIVVIATLERAPYVFTIEEKHPPNGTPFRGLFTYYFEGGKIKALWFERIADSVSEIPESAIDLTNCTKALAP